MTMKRSTLSALAGVVACAMMAINPTANAATVNVDFGAGGLYAAQGALASAGNTWNQGLAADGSSGALVDSLGNASAIGYTISGLVGVTAGNEGGEFVNIADLMGDAQRGTDSDPNSHLDLLITGLTANVKYNVALYGVQNQTFGGTLADNRGSIFTLAATPKTSTGTNTGLGDSFVEGQTHVTYLSVTANGSGEIDIDVDPFVAPADVGFELAVLNGFQVQNVPEPGSIILMVGCLIGLVGSGRRRHR